MLKRAEREETMSLVGTGAGVSYTRMFTEREERGREGKINRR